MAKQTFTTGQVLTAAQLSNLQQTAMLGGATTAKTTSYILTAADAGSAVTMNSASVTSITVNTALFAAGDLVTILNLGVGVTTIVSGTATVTKATGASLSIPQNAGGVLYFTSASAAIFLPFETSATSPEAAGKNKILNADFSIWQRGTSIASAASVVYGADRWSFFRAALGLGATMSRQSSTLASFQYAMRLQRDSGNTNTEQIIAFQPFESSASIPLAGKLVTYSFYARAGANFSAASSTLSATLITGTGTDQSPNSYRAGAWTGQAIALDNSQTISTSWTRYQGSVTLNSNITQIGIQIGFVPVGTAGANDWAEITGIQLEVNPIPTGFTTATGNFQAELAACQRYYYRSVAGGAYSVPAPSGFVDSATNVITFAPLPVPMRIAPTSIEWSSLQYFDASNAGATPSAIALNTARTTTTILSTDATTTGATAGRFAYLRANNSSSAYLAASAEL